jgi:NAD(P)-dependent dehydrogenase (short-subunit alcohol dehydrogenase family)
MDLKGTGIVVTGATGIAAATATMAADAGASVFVIARSAEQVESLVDSLGAAGGSADGALADLTQEQPTVDAFDAAASSLGRIDGLVAVAGGSGRRYGDGPLHDVSIEGWDRTVALNGLPAFLASREAIRHMSEQDPDSGGSRGSVVLIGSVLATSPVPDLFATHAYAAIKGGIDALAVALAAYYAPRGIRVNVVAPGLVDTPMAARAATDPEIVSYAKAKQPLARGLLSPDDVAGPALFLVSESGRRITGQTLAVDGGWTVTPS